MLSSIYLAMFFYRLALFSDALFNQRYIY